MPLKKKRPYRAPVAVEPVPIVYELPQIYASDTIPELVKDLGLTYRPGSIRSGKTPVSPNIAALRFHKPTSLYVPRMNDLADVKENESRRGSIASYYTMPSSYPASPNTQTGNEPRAAARRRTRPSLPSFNLMVLGRSGIGKTSFLKTLLLTSDIPHQATSDETRSRISAFGQHENRMKSTKQLEELTVELSAKGERVLLTVIDTPGLSSDELAAEVSINSHIRQIESRFAQTLDEETQIVRSTKNAGDNHIHLVLYFLDPKSFTNSSPIAHYLSRAPSQRTLGSSKSMPHMARSRSQSIRGQFKDAEGAEERQGDTEALMMSRCDLRMIHKLSKRVNVLPVIGRSDELTEMELEEYKAAVARDMKTAGLDFSVLGSPKETPLPSPFLESATSFMLTETTPDTTVEEQAVEEANEAPAAPLIRVRSRSNSTRKRTLNMYSDACPDTALISSKLPFALMAPSAFTPPFVRKFRYGQAEVENPEHCDFDLLKQTVLSTHFKALKDATVRQYEDYRTVQLSVRQATVQRGTDYDVFLL